MNEEEELLLLQKKKAMEEIEEKVGLAKDPVALTSIREGLIDWEDGVEGDYPLLKEEWFTLLSEVNELEWKIDNRGKPNIIDPAGDGDIEAVRLAIRNGADVNTVDHDNLTPLLAASYQGNLDIVRLLIEHGAYVNGPKNVITKTPLDAAMDQGHEDVCDLLRKHGEIIELELKSKHVLKDSESDLNYAQRQSLNVISCISIHNNIKKRLSKAQLKLLFQMALEYFRNNNDGYTCFYEKNISTNATGLTTIFKEKVDLTIFFCLNSNLDYISQNQDRITHTLGVLFREHSGKNNYTDYSSNYLCLSLEENIEHALNNFYDH